MNMGANAGRRCGKCSQAHGRISWADLIQMASATAIEMAGGPVIKMKYGRVSTTSPEQCAGPTSREGFKGNAGLPDGAPPFGCGASTPEERGIAHLRNVFGKKMGFTDQEIVALSGAHTIGYYSEYKAAMQDEELMWLPTDECLHTDAEFKKYFDKYAKDQTAMEDKDLMWLPTDECLHKDPEFKKYFYKYAGDKAAFFEDYALAHKKLSELGAKFDPPAGITI
eukprot:Skav221134  [mRNA]  locus=scaffold233:639835:655188:- [translate_table: standard]